MKEKKESRSTLNKRIQEGWPMVGEAREEEYGWRNITAQTERDLSPLTQKRMQDIAVYLYDANPIAHRIPEIMKDFVVGDGFSFDAKNPKVKKILDDFWNDPDNNWELRQEPRVLDLSLFGEQCYPVFINAVNGHVKMGYIDPGRITKVMIDLNNPEIVREVHWQRGRYITKAQKLKVVNIDKNRKSKTFGRLIGDCFYFAINKISPSSRGRSDLLCVSDWIDGYDQFLFARLERAFYLNNFVWDILCEGMGKDEITEFAKEQVAPKPGSMRFHNEKIKWEAITPKLEAADASEEARLFKNQILGGKGFPEHWFAEGSRTTRATAMEMGLPTLKMLKSRQRYVKSMLVFIFKFVIDQAIIHKELGPEEDTSFSIMPSPIVAKDIRGVALTLDRFTEALVKAKEAGWVSDVAAKKAFQSFIKELGIELREIEEISEEKERYGKAKKKDKRDETS